MSNLKHNLPGPRQVVVACLGVRYAQDYLNTTP
jgi:hypothetical protein